MSVEAEMSVIGCMVLDEESAKYAIDELTPEMFSHETTKRIFTVATNHFWAGSPIDVVTLIGLLPEDKMTILRLAEYVPTTRHLQEYIHIVHDDWRRSCIGRVACDIMADCKIRTAEESVELLRELVKEQDLITKAQAGKGISFADAVRQFLQWMCSHDDEGGNKSGYRHLDKATGGFLRSSVTALCARSGGGKTDFAINLAMRMVKRGKKVLYCSMEMPAKQLMERVASQMTRIDGTKIRDRDLTLMELSDIEELLQAFEQANKMHFIEESRLSLKSLRHNIDLFRPDVVYIDHIGLMARPDAKDSYKALGQVSNAIKQLAMEKNIAIIELAQMNRQIEARKDKQPTLADIRESGDIEQDADYVLFVQPEDMSGKNLSGDGWADVTLHLMKNRHGRPGKFLFHWQPQYHTFTEVDAKYEQK